MQLKQIFDTAVAKGGLRLRFDTPAMATQWRHRANKFRKRLREEFAERNFGVATASPYDHFTLRIAKTEPTVVVIEEAPERFIIEDLHGGNIELEDTDELAMAAKAFAATLKGDEDE